MDLKKLIVALVAGFIVMIVLAGLWHLLILADFYKSYHVGAREQPMIGFIVLAYIILALIMAYIYPVGYKGGAPAKEGIRFGIVVGLLWVLPMSLATHGMAETSGTVLIVDAIWHVIEEGIGGLVIGLIYGKPVAPAAA